MNQKVIVIPIENETDLGELAAGGLHKYANPSLIEQEKDAWRKAAVRQSGKHFTLFKNKGIIISKK